MRTLARTLAKAVRKAVVSMLETGDKKLAITVSNLETFLGPPRFLRDKPEQTPWWAWSTAWPIPRWG